jgi:large subunit ribosomal protein L6
MSNLGNQQILIPTLLKLKYKGWILSLHGKYGNSTIFLPEYTQIVYKNRFLSIINPYISSNLYGSLQRELRHLVIGLSFIHKQIVAFVGVGYRPRIEKKIIILRLGFSHEISLPIPTNLEVEIVKKQTMLIKATSYSELRQFCYKLRSCRPPEPFKGKGIVCLGEVVRRKEGKKKQI